MGHYCISHDMSRDLNEYFRHNEIIGWPITIIIKNRLLPVNFTRLNIVRTPYKPPIGTESPSVTFDTSYPIVA